jgi:hypothetical protein
MTKCIEEASGEAGRQGSGEEGNFITQKTTTGYRPDEQNKYNVNETNYWVHRIERIRGKPT